jgi:hypothetical protein
MEDTLTRNCYTTKGLTGIVGVKPRERRALFKQELCVERAVDLHAEVHKYSGAIWLPPATNSRSRWVNEPSSRRTS